MAARRRKPKIKVPVLHALDHDIGTAELHAKEPVEVYGQDRKRRARVLSSPLDYYYSRGWIDRDQHRAGNQFYKFWYQGGGRPSLATLDLNRIPGISDTDLPGDMRAKYRAACDSFTRPIHRHIVFEVTCAGEYADAAMRAAIRAAVEGAADPKNKGISTLRNGLDDLVTHFTRKRQHEGVDKQRREK